MGEEERVSDPMTRLRQAFRTFIIERMVFDLEEGEYDDTLRMFIEGKVAVEDTIEITFTVSTIPNDILVFRELAGFPKDDQVTERVKNLWRNTRRVLGWLRQNR